ncbi:8-oxo-dGTP pyrophosphatase MutT (NUDIX family) [Filimonas zeae]|uniref:DNA mismatch repair protein MutT n=1 Tax=Filimonas zeae TaxID=1737353 RepID=A0A917ISU5_9BACT|nr:NUDIX domain-containing protein [Filimonas zeae]MDR6337897.1 8-oxo-dGTP pyrophosphatase MutT (NUDIX family) [Filimonas zeae]GGH60776.1 DNA mismatch repair protein MutT [Filimonas zeae]
MNKVIHCAGLIVVKERKLLLAFSNNKQAWYLPGGKIDAGETPLMGLRREIQEELNLQLPEESLSWYYHITAPAFGEDNITMQQHCFMHQLTQQPQPAAEIGGVQYFSQEEYQLQPHQVTGVLMAFEKLRQDNLVD